MSEQRSVPTGDDGRGGGFNIKLAVAALILVGALFFVVQNTQDIAVTWLFFSFTMPLWGLSLVLLGAGLVLGWGLNMRRNRRRRG